MKLVKSNIYSVTLSQVPKELDHKLDEYPNSDLKADIDPYGLVKVLHLYPGVYKLKTPSYTKKGALEKFYYIINSVINTNHIQMNKDILFSAKINQEDTHQWMTDLF